MKIHSSNCPLFPPDPVHAGPFPLSVQYRFVTKEAPRGGLQPPLSKRLQSAYYILLYNVSLIHIKDFTTHPTPEGGSAPLRLGLCPHRPHKR